MILRFKEIGNRRGEKRFSGLRVEHFISKKVYYSEKLSPEKCIIPANLSPEKCNSRLDVDARNGRNRDSANERRDNAWKVRFKKLFSDFQPDPLVAVPVPGFAINRRSGDGVKRPAGCDR